jgi:hypothetical protein
MIRTNEKIQQQIINDPAIRDKLYEKFNHLRNSGSDQTHPSSFWSSKYGDRRTHANTNLYQTPMRSDYMYEDGHRQSPRFTQFLQSDYIGDDGKIYDDAMITETRGKQGETKHISESDEDKGHKSMQHNRNELKQEYYANNFSFKEEQKRKANKDKQQNRKFDSDHVFAQTVDVDDNDNELEIDGEENVDRQYAQDEDRNLPKVGHKNKVGDKHRSYERKSEENEPRDSKYSLKHKKDNSKYLKHRFPNSDLQKKRHSDEVNIDQQDESNIHPGFDEDSQPSSKNVSGMRLKKSNMYDLEHDEKQATDKKKNTNKANLHSLQAPIQRPHLAYMNKLEKGAESDTPINSEESFDEKLNKLTKSEAKIDNKSGSGKKLSSKQIDSQSSGSDKEDIKIAKKKVSKKDFLKQANSSDSLEQKYLKESAPNEQKETEETKRIRSKRNFKTMGLKDYKSKEEQKHELLEKNQNNKESNKEPNQRDSKTEKKSSSGSNSIHEKEGEFRKINFGGAINNRKRSYKSKEHKKYDFTKRAVSPQQLDKSDKFGLYKNSKESEYSSSEKSDLKKLHQTEQKQTLTGRPILPPGIKNSRKVQEDQEKTNLDPKSKSGRFSVLTTEKEKINRIMQINQAIGNKSESYLGKALSNEKTQKKRGSVKMYNRYQDKKSQIRSNSKILTVNLDSDINSQLDSDKNKNSTQPIQTIQNVLSSLNKTEEILLNKAESYPDEEELKNKYRLKTLIYSLNKHSPDLEYLPKYSQGAIYHRSVHIDNEESEERKEEYGSEETEEMKFEPGESKIKQNKQNVSKQVNNRNKEETKALPKKDQNKLNKREGDVNDSTLKEKHDYSKQFESNEKEIDLSKVHNLSNILKGINSTDPDIDLNAEDDAHNEVFDQAEKRIMKNLPSAPEVVDPIVSSQLDSIIESNDSTVKKFVDVSGPKLPVSSLEKHISLAEDSRSPGIIHPLTVHDFSKRQESTKEEIFVGIPSKNKGNKIDKIDMEEEESIEKDDHKNSKQFEDHSSGLKDKLKGKRQTIKSLHSLIKSTFKNHKLININIEEQNQFIEDEEMFDHPEQIYIPGMNWQDEQEDIDQSSNKDSDEEETHKASKYQARKLKHEQEDEDLKDEGSMETQKRVYEPLNIDTINNPQSLREQEEESDKKNTVEDIQKTRLEKLKKGIEKNQKELKEKYFSPKHETLTTDREHDKHFEFSNQKFTKESIKEQKLKIAKEIGELDKELQEEKEAPIAQNDDQKIEEMSQRSKQTKKPELTLPNLESENVDILNSHKKPSQDNLIAPSHFDKFDKLYKEESIEKHIRESEFNELEQDEDFDDNEGSKPIANYRELYDGKQLQRQDLQEDELAYCESDDPEIREIEAKYIKLTELTDQKSKHDVSGNKEQPSAKKSKGGYISMRDRYNLDQNDLQDVHSDKDKVNKGIYKGGAQNINKSQDEIHYQNYSDSITGFDKDKQIPRSEIPSNFDRKNDERYYSFSEKTDKADKGSKYTDQDIVTIQGNDRISNKEETKQSSRTNEGLTNFEASFGRKKPTAGVFINQEYENSQAIKVEQANKDKLIFGQKISQAEYDNAYNPSRGIIGTFNQDDAVTGKFGEKALNYQEFSDSSHYHQFKNNKQRQEYYKKQAENDKNNKFKKYLSKQERLRFNNDKILGKKTPDLQSSNYFKGKKRQNKSIQNHLFDAKESRILIDNRRYTSDHPEGNDSSFHELNKIIDRLPIYSDKDPRFSMEDENMHKTPDRSGDYIRSSHDSDYLHDEYQRMHQKVINRLSGSKTAAKLNLKKKSLKKDKEFKSELKRKTARNQLYEEALHQVRTELDEAASSMIDLDYTLLDPEEPVILDSGLMKFHPGFSINYVARWVQLTKTVVRFYKNYYHSVCSFRRPLAAIPIQYIKTIKKVRCATKKSNSTKIESKGGKNAYDMNQFEIVLKEDYEAIYNLNKKKKEIEDLKYELELIQRLEFQNDMIRKYKRYRKA